jgi:hypothetical protein
MGKLIEFYVPDGFRSKTKRKESLEGPRVIEFPSSKSDIFHQVTWIFPEVDADLA